MRTNVAILGGFILANMLFFIVTLKVGIVETSWGAMLSGLKHDPISLVRMPRSILAFISGASLAMIGTLLQAMTRNRIAAPDIVGMTSMACLAIIIVQGFWAIHHPVVLVLASIGGALLGFILVYFFANGHRNMSSLIFILVGIALGLGVTALTQFLLLNSHADVTAYLAFLAGSFYGTRWDTILLIAPFMAVLWVIGLSLTKYLDLLRLDDETGLSLGYNFGHLRIGIFLLASILTGFTVLGTGNIGFIGVVAPNLARFIMGNKHKLFMPCAMLLGGFITMFGDFLGRSLFAPIEVPAGLVCNVMSVPIFLWLLRRYIKKGGVS